MGRLIAFGKSSIKSEKPLELIHSDLLTCPTASYSGFYYMLVLVDDYTRFTWVYFMREKSETFGCFKRFKRIVEAEFQSGIWCFRTDNGTEYITNEFIDFCEEQGIRRQMTCTGTSQQNGVAERKLRHLQEVSRSWLHAKNAGIVG